MLEGRFDLLGELGSGASGTVFKAKTRTALADLPAGSEVAIKFLRQDLLGDEKARLQMLAEGELGMRLRSPHVIRMYAVERVPLLGLELVYLVMELVQGRTLRRFLSESGPAVEDLARRIGLDAALGLADLHALGVVHRDIKPENLVLTFEGQVKLMDLGLARPTETLATSHPARHEPRRPTTSLGNSGGFAGSLPYAAPETLRGKPASPASDLYSLGVVLYEVCTGRHPFYRPGIEIDELMHAHLEIEPERPSYFQPRLSAFLERVVLELLQKEPAKRIKSAGELAGTLERGESSPWWTRHEKQAPALGSRRRLREIRRLAPTPFFGREDEVAVLDQNLDEALLGRGTAIRLAGPEGVGRRRLVDECVDRWLKGREDLVFFGGEARPSGAIGGPFPAFLLDWFLRGDREDSPNVQARLAARIKAESGLKEKQAGTLAALICGRDPGDSPEARAELLVEGLLNCTRDGRTLVVRLDRPERLDTTGKLVLERLLEALVGKRVLLILVVGVEEGQQPFAHETLQIAGLALPTFLAFGAALFADGHAPRVLLEGAHGTLAGNPGNLLEALEALAQRGELVGEPGSYSDLSADEIRPAGPLLQRVRERVKDLPAEKRHVLVAAAVLGDLFPLQDLVHLTGQTELAVLEALSAFQGRVIKAERGLGAFRHRDYRLALAELVEPQVRRRLHRMAAWVLEDRGAPPLEVGMHHSRAGEHDACVPFLLRGLEDLVHAGSRQRSLRLSARLRLHLNSLPRTGKHLDERLHWLVLAGQAHAQAELSDEAQRCFKKARILARHLGSKVMEAQALVGQAAILQGSARFAPALPMLAEAEGLVRGRDDDASRVVAARALDIHARVLGYLGLSVEGSKLALASLDLLPPRHGFRVHVLVDLARLLALRAHFLPALKALARAERVLRSQVDPGGLLRWRLHHGRVLQQVGDLDAARAEYEEGRILARRQGNVRMLARCALFLGEIEAFSGNRETAIDSLRDAYAGATRCKDDVTRAQAMVRLQGLGVPMRGTEELVGTLALPFLEVAWLLVRVREERAAGNADTADSLLERARAIDRTVTLPLGIYLGLLAAAGHKSRAQKVIAGVATRFGRLPLKKKFVAWANQVLAAQG